MKQLFIFFLLLMPIWSFSQNDNTDSLLDSQLGSYQYRLQSLMSSRGFTGYPNGKIKSESLFYALGKYEDNKNFFLLFYHFDNGKLWVWLLDNNGIVAKQVVITTAKELSELEGALKHTIGAISHTTSPELALNRGLKIVNEYKNDKNNIDSVQKNLCDILIPHRIANAILKTGDAHLVKHLLIVPELNIATIPYYLLKPFGDSSYLIDKASICFEPSLDELLNRIAYYQNSNSLGGEVTFTPDKPLIVGNPDFKGCTEYNSLAGAETEAIYASSSLHTSLLTGREANKKNVQNKARQSEFLYFATHGVADDKHPLDSSYLVLSGTNSCEYWTAREIQFDTFKKDAVIVLSACQTGLGKAAEAGIMGIGRSFIKGGAGNVIMSLWSINDKSTVDLMHLFIDELKVPHVFYPADNLRSAILKYKAINQDPAAWAPFTIMGTPYPLNYLVHLNAGG